MSLYRAYFVPREMDPFGLQEEDGKPVLVGLADPTGITTAVAGGGVVVTGVATATGTPVIVVTAGVTVSGAAGYGYGRCWYEISPHKWLLTRVCDRWIDSATDFDPISDPIPIPNPQPPRPPIPPKTDCDDDGGKCEPCDPAVGIVIYEIAKPGTRTNGRHSRPPHNQGHVKHWVVGQTPYDDCKCVWNKNKPFTLENTQTPLPIGTIEGTPKTVPLTGGGPS